MCKHAIQKAESHCKCCHAGLQDFAVGDEVLGLAPGCLGSHVVVPVGLMVHKPPGLSFEEAATAPTVYTTVQTAFGGGRGMGPGTKVRTGPDWLQAMLVIQSTDTDNVSGSDTVKLAIDTY